MTITEATSIATQPTAETVSDAWLIAWTLARSNAPCEVAVGDGIAAALQSVEAHYSVHLAGALPVRDIVRALQNLRGKRAPDAVLILSQRAPSSPYVERLAVDDQQRVVKIHRTFTRHEKLRAPRPYLLGIVWKSGIRHLERGRPWRSLHALRRQKVRIATQLAIDPPQVDDVKSHLIGQLNPAALKGLASELGFAEVRDFCFAHTTARVDDLAHLRGPLFIDAGTVIPADHTHIGPAWVRADTGAVTLPSAPPHTLAMESAYFVGPPVARRPIYRFFKRVFDVAMALAAIIITLPICLIVAVIIKLYDRGPIFFAHQRETLGGRPFFCLKFRTMVRDAERIKNKLRQANQVDGPQFKIANDPRITPIGHFLRKTNIDELPQFWNVLMGDMSVVGPRPSPFEENQLCPGWREARLSVKPGITGLWQISRSRQRGAADFQEWIFYDTQYVDRRSFSLDLTIVLLTIKELFGKGQ